METGAPVPGFRFVSGAARPLAGAPPATAGTRGSLYPPYRAPARPIDLDEERQGRLGDRFIRADVNVAAPAVLLDNGELEELENRQPRDPGELELGW